MKLYVNNEREEAINHFVIDLLYDHIRKTTTSKNENENRWEFDSNYVNVKLNFFRKRRQSLDRKARKSIMIRLMFEKSTREHEKQNFASRDKTKMKTWSLSRSKRDWVYLLLELFVAI